MKSLLHGGRNLVITCMIMASVTDIPTDLVLKVGYSLIASGDHKALSLLASVYTHAQRAGTGRLLFAVAKRKHWGHAIQDV